MTQGIEIVSVELTDHEWCALATWVIRDGDGVGLDAAAVRDVGNSVRITLLPCDLRALAQFVSGELPSPRSFGWDPPRVGFLASARDKITTAYSTL